MRKVTSGDWQHQRESGDWQHQRESGGVAYIMAGDVCIATMNSTRDGEDNETREREAFGNGEIMAASKALLSACQSMQRHLIGIADSPHYMPDCYHEANAAIKQAVERRDWPTVETSDCCEGCHKPIPVQLGGVCDACLEGYREGRETKKYSGIWRRTCPACGMVFRAYNRKHIYCGAGCYHAVQEGE